MNEQQLSLFIAWVEDQITECKIMISTAESDDLKLYFEGQLFGFEMVYQKLQSL